MAKVKRGQPLTETDLAALEQLLFSEEALGDKDAFAKAVLRPGESLPLFVRRLVGLDRNAAKAAFGRWIEGTALRADQIRFVETLIDYLTQNGVMDPALLYEPPFSDLHDDGLDGVFSDEDADRIVEILRGFNESVGARFGMASSTG